MTRLDKRWVCRWFNRRCSRPTLDCLACGKWKLITCGICDKPILPGQLIGETTDGQYVHAGFQDDGSFCETGGIASGYWDGNKKVPIDWSQS